MKKLLQIFLLSLLLLDPSILFAASQFNASYLISDEEMTAKSAMNREDIEAFLRDKGSKLIGMKLPDKDGESRDAADIIYRAAQEHRINPKYLLVKLQKEQSLVFDQSISQKQLDWATGYGVCDACSMSDPSIQKHKGFGTQVDSAAGIIRWYYDNHTKERWIKRPHIDYIIDDQTVRPANHATAFLYTYTPHILGNKNFWTLWQSWFDQVYPNGTLMKANGDTVVYLVKDKKRHAFANMGALTSRFNPKLIVTVPQAELSNYEVGPSISLPNYAILKQGSSYYLLDDDTLRPFASYSVVQQLGFHPDEIISVSHSDIAQYRRGSAITAATNPQGRVVKIKENGALYYIKDSQYFPVYDERISSANYPNTGIESVSASELGQLVSGSPILLKDGILFGIEGENSIYVVEDGRKRHIVSEDVFNGLGYDWNNIVWVNTFAGMAHQTGEPIYSKPSASATPTPSQPIVSTPAPALNEKMWTTPAAETTFVGPRFETGVNTYLVADHKTGDILAGKNIDDVRPIASFTKVMTAYQLFRDGFQTHGSVTYSPTAHKSIYHRYAIGSGDQVLNKDLLSAMLLSSLNTPVNMVVSSVEENRSTFVSRMNATAKELGLSKTTFTSPTGEDVETQSTAREYLTIFSRAVRNRTLREELGAASYAYTKLQNVSGVRDSHYDNHSNKLVAKANLPFRIVASKTGYLEESGDGLVMLVERLTDGKQFTIITMGNPDHANRFDAPESLARWAMSSF